MNLQLSVYPHPVTYVKDFQYFPRSVLFYPVLFQLAFFSVMPLLPESEHHNNVRVLTLTLIVFFTHNITTQDPD